MPATLTVTLQDDTLADLRREAADTGTTPEVVAARRLADAFPPPGPQPRRTAEEIADALARIADATAFRERLAARHGVMPDSTLDIVADRRRDD